MAEALDYNVFQLYSQCWCNIFFAACGIPIIYAHRQRDRKREPHNGKISLMLPADYDKEGCE